MTLTERQAIDKIMRQLTEHGHEVFNIVTQAVMQADPEAERFDRGSIREGLTAAIEIMDIYDRMNKAN